MKMTGDWEVAYYTIIIKYNNGTKKSKRAYTEESVAEIIENLADEDIYSVKVTKLLNAIII